MSLQRATESLVAKCSYTSGGRNAGVSGKRGLLHLRSYDYTLLYFLIKKFVIEMKNKKACVRNKTQRTMRT